MSGIFRRSHHSIVNSKLGTATADLSDEDILVLPFERGGGGYTLKYFHVSLAFGEIKLVLVLLNRSLTNVLSLKVSLNIFYSICTITYTQTKVNGIGMEAKCLKNSFPWLKYTD